MPLQRSPLSCPGIKEGAYDLFSHVDVDKLELTLADLADKIGMRLTVCNLKGDYLPTNLPPYCKMNVSNPAISSMCAQERVRDIQEILRTGEPLIRECHLGFMRWAAPIKLEGEVIGVIFGDSGSEAPPNLHKARQHARHYGLHENAYVEAVSQCKTVTEEYCHHSMEWSSTVANMITSLAYSSHLLMEAKRQQSEALSELEYTQLATIQALAMAVDARDPYTRYHTERTARYSLHLAAHILALSATLEKFRHALFLHDIGKIGVPDTILGKADELTPEEWSLIRQHPDLGAKIIAPVKFLHETLLTVRHHHERFDGLGYPDGLAGESIPLQARILAIADAFDAMTTDRPYRKAHSFEYALAEIKRNAGQQFDPNLADIFTNIPISELKSQ